MATFGGGDVQDGQVERGVFRELLFRLKLSRYEPLPEEVRALKACESDALTRATIGGCAAATGFFFATRRAQALSSVYLRGSLGTIVAIVAGYYSAATATTDCLCSILRLDTPIGGEAAAILEKLAPTSELLQERREALRISVSGAEDMGRDGSGVLRAAKDAARKRVITDEDLQQRIKELMSRGHAGGLGRGGRGGSPTEGGSAQPTPQEQEFGDGYGGDGFDSFGGIEDDEHDFGKPAPHPISQRKELEELRRRRAAEAYKARHPDGMDAEPPKRRNKYGDEMQ